MIINYFNKIYFGFFILSFLAMTSCNPKKEQINTSQNQSDQSISFKYSAKTKNYVSAHRGGSEIKGYTKNCIETY